MSADRPEAGGRAGALLARLAVVPALLVACWLVVGMPLLMAGAFTPGVTTVLFVVVAAVVLPLGLRAVRPVADTPWWAVVAVLVVVCGFLALQTAMVSEQIVVRRDPGSYFQFATWLTGHGSLPIPQHREAFGGGDPALSFASPAFYQRGHAIVPQFMAGMPILVSAGGWLGGAAAMLGCAPVLGALAVLSFGGLVARLVGPRWAPLGALALALTFPMMYVSRSVFSEPAALVLLLGGLLMALDAAHRRGGGDRSRTILAALAGLTLGLTVLVRIDGLRDVLPVVVFAGVLFGLRRPTGLPLFCGLATGVAAGLVEGFALSGPYLAYLHASLNPLLAMGAATIVGTVVLAVLLRRRGPPDLTGFRPLRAAPALVVLTLVVFAVRPYVQTVRRTPHTHDDKVNAGFIAATQRANGLPVDPTRMYSELSLHWVAWYIGIPAVLLATVGAALLVRRMLRRRAVVWALPYAMIAWTTVTVLWRPAITPDHPWASRRLIQVVIPGLLLLAVWTSRWAVRRVRRLGYGRRVTGGVAGLGVSMLLVPIVATSGGVMFTPTDQGEIAAAHRMCAAIGPRASVLLVEKATANMFAQLVRGMCAVPTARVEIPHGASAPDADDVRRIVTKIAAVGRRPVVLGADRADVAPYGRARRVFHVATKKDSRSLTSAPQGTWHLVMNVWMAEPR